MKTARKKTSLFLYTFLYKQKNKNAAKKTGNTTIEKS